jgi:hypothetical protein
MNSVINYFLSSLLTVCVLTSCFSQQLVKKQADARLIIEQKERFINKPLKDLLKEIKPEIKYAFGTDAGDHGVPAYFRFKFVTKEQSDSLRAKNLSPILIIVYVKENIDWNEPALRKKDILFTWTEDDFQKYKNYTVIDLRVYNDATTDN